MNLPTTIVTVLPFLALVPPDGLCERTTPFCACSLTFLVDWETLKPAALIAPTAADAVWPVTLGTLAVAGGACATTRSTVEPGGACVAPPGDWLITSPAGVPLVCCVVIDPTLNPAFTIADRAADSDWPVTSGTATSGRPDETTSVIDEPAGTGCPADGLVSITLPVGIESLVSETVRPTAEMIPSVTLLARPSGLPMASTISPTCSLEESAKRAGTRCSAPVTWITARSSGG